MHKRTLALLALASCATVSPPPPDTPKEAAPAAAAPAPAPAWHQARAVVIRHATVLPASGPAIQDGAVAFADGKLVAVGKDADVQTPAGAEEVDGTGMYVTPGIIDAHSHLGVYASPSIFSTSDGNEMSSPVTAEVNAQHSYWPQDPGLRRAAAGGVTSLLVLPGSGNLIGGRGFPAKLHFGRTAQELRFPGAPDSLKMACGENPRRVYGGRGGAPQTRMGNVAGYRQAFAQAKAYMDRLDEYERKRQKDGDKAGPAPERNLRMETLADVLRGKILVQNHCYRADEMANMLEVAQEFGFPIRAFHHAVEAYKVGDKLAARDVASAIWADWWGFKLEAWDGIPHNAGLLHQAGARVVIHSDSALGIQRLNQEAAKAMWRAREAGITVTDDDALRWVTLNPAWAMGVDAQTGSLEKGKMADVVLWRGHPLSAYARAERVWADGVVTYDMRTGAADPSDFEVGQREMVNGALSAKPAPRPTLPGPCDPAQESCQHVALDAAATCTLFRDVTVLSEGRPAPGSSVLVQEGKVLRVGAQGLAAPADCRTVEGKGLVLSPGLMDPLTALGLVEVAGEESTNDLGPRNGASKEPVHAALRASDAFNPASATLAVARQGGVTAAGAVPSGGLVAGQSAFVTTDGQVRRAPLALHLNLNGTGRDALSSSRAAVLEHVRELFTDAREYARRRQDFEQNRMRPLVASRLDLEAVLPALSGQLPVVVAADRASDIRAALALGREFGLKLVLAGGAEAWQVADALAAARVPVVLQPTQNLPASFDSLGSRLDAAALLERAGVKVVLSTLGEPYLVRTLPQEAGNAVAWGLPYEAAFKAVTSNVADAFGLQGGRVAPGAPADLVLWSGDPLELSSRPLGMWVGGKQVPVVSRQDALLEKYRTLPARAAPAARR